MLPLKLQRWSPRERPWPRRRSRGHILKSLALASKPTSPQKYSVLGSRTAVCLDWTERKITRQKIIYSSSLSIRFISLIF